MPTQCDPTTHRCQLFSTFVTNLFTRLPEMAWCRCTSCLQRVCGQNKNLAQLNQGRRSCVCADPRVAIACSAMRSKCSGDSHMPAAARHPEAAISVQHVARPREFSHRRGHQHLPLGVACLFQRITDAASRRSKSVRHVEYGAQHVTDAMAAPIGTPTTAAPSRARCQSGNPSGRRDRRVGLHRAKTPAQHRKTLQTHARRHRDEPRASTGLRRNGRRRGCRSKETAIRRVHGQGGIEDGPPAASPVHGAAFP